MPSSTSAWRIQRCSVETEMSKSAATSCNGHGAPPGDGDDVPLELLREPLGHGSILSERQILSKEMSTRPAADPDGKRRGWSGATVFDRAFRLCAHLPRNDAVRLLDV